MTLSATDQEIIARLAPPGAGIPWHQRMMLRWYYRPFVAGRSNWEDNWRQFDKFNHKILSVIKPLTEEQLATRVLVDPIPAIEDSSRYWSAAMTLEHLVIVGRGVVSVIKQLGNGTMPPRVVGTAEFKPTGLIPPTECVEQFKKFTQGARLSIESAVPLPIDRRLKFTHPWMRSIDPIQWQWMIGAHTAVHYRQIKAIIRGLPGR